MIQASTTKPKGTNMILKPEFVHMVNQLGLEDAELTIAEIVWQKAERAMQGLPLQEATLLKKQWSTATTPQANQLTREDVQFLVDFNTDFLNIAQDNMHRLTETIQEVWLACDPENPATEMHFEELNQLRSFQRKFKSDIRKLERIQHKLKKMR